MVVEARKENVIRKISLVWSGHYFLITYKCANLRRHNITIAKSFNTSRMISDYFQQLYLQCSMRAIVPNLAPGPEFFLGGRYSSSHQITCSRSIHSPTAATRPLLIESALKTVLIPINNGVLTTIF